MGAGSAAPTGLAKDDVGQEARVLVGHQPCRFPDAEPRGLVLDDPGAQHDPVAVEVWQRGQLLVAARLVPYHHGASRLMDRDAGALTAEQRLGDIADATATATVPVPGQFARTVEIGGQQIRMTRIELPEDGQQRLVGKEHLPGGLDPAGGARAAAVVEGVQDMGAEAVGRQPLPRVELEAATDEAEPVVDEPPGQPVPADLFHGERLRVDPGLFGGLTEIRDRHQVLAQFVPLGVGEMQWSRWQQCGLPLPCRDEAFMKGVPLVGVREAVLHPEPLRTGRLHE